MFQSKTRPIVIPQSEHARFAGMLAQVWGNSQFEAPSIDRDAFVSGVTHHDRGYGLLDTMSIMDVSDAVWLDTQRRGILHTPLSKPDAEIVALMHIRRLLASTSRPGTEDVLLLADATIARHLAQTETRRETFEHLDTITNLCDSIAFDFCFEEPSQFRQAVFARQPDEMREIDVQITSGVQVHLSPWPFAVEQIHGFIIGYEAQGYPDHLRPVIVPFRVQPACRCRVQSK